jgi:hypothetical protein
MKTYGGISGYRLIKKLEYSNPYILVASVRGCKEWLLELSDVIFPA